MTKPSTLPTPFNLYREIVLLDEWGDNDFEATAPDRDLQGGTSVRAGVKALQKRGHIASYLWATDVEDVRAWHLAGFGDVVLGTTWKHGMLNADADGVIHATGRDEGGHSYQSCGWTDNLIVRSSTLRTRRAGRIKNSWTDEWAEKGRAWILDDDIQKLLDEDGECCAAVEQKVLPL